MVPSQDPLCRKRTTRYCLSLKATSQSEREESRDSLRGTRWLAGIILFTSDHLPNRRHLDKVTDQHHGKPSSFYFIFFPNEFCLSYTIRGRFHPKGTGFPHFHLLSPLPPAYGCQQGTSADTLRPCAVCVKKV